MYKGWLFVRKFLSKKIFFSKKNTSRPWIRRMQIRILGRKAKRNRECESENFWTCCFTS